MENNLAMRLAIDSSLSVRSLPTGRSLVLTAVAMLLAATDWLPPNPYIDPDHVEFVLTVGLGVSAIAISVRERVESVTIARWRNRVLLGLITIAISTAVVEPMARFVFRDVTSSSDNGGYFTQRWFRTGAVHQNSSGFREREFSAVKPAGTYRIAVVGDSFTWGNGVRQEDRYSNLLQARLPSHFEVLNFGAAGANTPQHHTLIGHLLSSAHPDFVLLQWYVNDVEDDDSTGRPSFVPLIPIRGMHDWLSINSALYTVANMKWSETQVALGMTAGYTTYLHRRFADPDSHDSQVDRALLVELVALCKRAGVPIGIVLFPDTAGDLRQGYPFGYLHDRVHDVCRAEGLTCLDLLNDFSLVKDRRLLWASRLDHHPSALANEIAAVKIFETYATIWATSPQR